MHSRKWLMVVAGIGLCSMLISPGTTNAQKFGPPRGGFDPESRWAELVREAGGSGDTLQLERLAPDSRERMKRFASFSGQTPFPDSGTISKQQYLDHMAKGIQSFKDRGSMGGPPGGGPFGGGPPGGGPPGGFSSRGSSSSPDEILRKFKEYDRNNDGKISMDEASDRTKQYFATYDTNKDGFLDLQEYTAYRTTSYGAPPPAPGAPGTPPPAYASVSPSPPAWAPPAPGAPSTAPGSSSTDPKLVAYRFGNIPKEVPSWFTKDDIDHDGQIGLYEWIKAGKDPEEFAALNLNNDGFITPEEWLRAQKLIQDKARQDELVASVTDGTTIPATSGSKSLSGSSSSRGPWGSKGSSKDSSSKDNKDGKDKGRSSRR